LVSIQTGDLVHFKPDFSAGYLGEALFLKYELVTARLKRGEVVSAGFVRRSLSLDSPA
jgi:hypothetical protein